MAQAVALNERCHPSRRPPLVLDLSMKTRQLTDALARVETWPPDVQNELAELAIELDAGVKGDAYRPAPDGLAGIDRGLRAATEGRRGSDA